LSSQAATRNTESLDISSIVTGYGKVIVFSRLKFSSNHRQIVESDDPESSEKKFPVSSYLPQVGK